MLRHLQKALFALTVAAAVHSAQAFSLIGPREAWQTPEIGYDPLGFDIGGPLNLGEEYRWNLKTITYGIDESFLNYFGQKGVDAVNKAVAILNSVPACSQMSANLAEFPTDTRRANYRASALGLQDVKSALLGMLTEELGLASPERYAWTLRDRRVINAIPYYLVIKRNFDPVTLSPTPYVNGVLYTYGILEFPGPWWDAIEVQVDPLASGFTAVASDIDSLVTSAAGSGASGPGLGFGEFYAGLTRDDVGGLRYLYRASNVNTENVAAGASLANSSSPWWPAGQTGGTNAPVGVSPRPGVDHLTFQQGRYDSMMGQFITQTNQYQDTYITNSTLVTQTIQRVLTQPDILISAEDLGLDGGGHPIFIRRTFAAAPVWINNDALNGQAALAGPGVISGPIVLTFNKIGPFIYNLGPFDGGSFLDEITGFGGWVWGSFDGTANEPVVYPVGSSIQELEQQVLNGY